MPSPSKALTIKNAKGLHARAAALFVKCVEKYDAEVSVTRNDETVSGASIMELLMLAAGPGTTLTVSTSGLEADEALRALSELVDQGFYETD